MRLLAHFLMKLFVLIVQSSVSYLFEMTISTQSSEIVTSTKLSTITPKSVDTQIAASLDPILQQLAKMEERLVKLRA